MRKNTLLILFCCLAISTGLFSQDRFQLDHFSSEFLNSLANSRVDLDDDWSFYQDPENKLYLIDLETIRNNIQDIVVLNKLTKEIIWEESIFDLPVNSIYELDYSQYPKGKYQLELRSINGVLKKEIEIK